MAAPSSSVGKSSHKTHTRMPSLTISSCEAIAKKVSGSTVIPQPPLQQSFDYVPTAALAISPLQDFVESTLLFTFDAVNMVQANVADKKMSEILGAKKYINGMVCKALCEDGKSPAYYFPLKFKTETAAMPRVFYRAWQEGGHFVIDIVKMPSLSDPTTWEVENTFQFENFEGSDAFEFTQSIADSTHWIYEATIGSNSARKRSTTSEVGQRRVSKGDSQKTDDSPRKESPRKDSTEKVKETASAAQSAAKPVVMPPKASGAKDPFEEFMTKHFITPFSAIIPMLVSKKLSELLKTKGAIKPGVITQCLSESTMKKAYVIVLETKKSSLPDDTGAFLTFEDKGSQVYHPRVVYMNYVTKTPSYPTPTEQIDTKKSYDSDETFQMIQKIFQDNNAYYRPNLSKKVSK